MNHVAPPCPTAETPKRKLMLDAAVALFMAHGYGAVSMDAVARTAGVSKATLYAHFTSKDQLFATIVADACRQGALQDGQFVEDPDGIQATLLRIGGRLLRFMLHPRRLAIYRLVVAESSRFPELGHAFMTNGPQMFQDRLALFLADQTEAGVLNAPSPDRAAEQFCALIRAGLFMRATLALAPPPDEAAIDACVSAAVETFLRAFRPS